jgi:hypothetical protein
MKYFSSLLDLDQISYKRGILRDVKLQTATLITHFHTRQRLGTRGAKPPLKYTFAMRVAEAQATFSIEKKTIIFVDVNSLNAKLNPICHLLTLLVAHHILQVSR